MEKYSLEANYAKTQDEKDPLRTFRQKFYIPRRNDGQEVHYFGGNSLGAQPKQASHYVNEELGGWKNLGVEGHIHGKNPWEASTTNC